MSSFRGHRRVAVPTSSATQRKRRRVAAVVCGVVIVTIAVGVSIGLVMAGSDGTRAVDSATGGHGAALPDGHRLTGEIAPMGGHIIETPGTRSGASSAGGVTVDGSNVEMGHVPLAFAVKPTWQLRNLGSSTVTLGRPKVTVVTGCCPSEPELATHTLVPGGQTTLEYPTQMHPGMDGEHLFKISVPVEDAAEPLVLTLSGDFR